MCYKMSLAMSKGKLLKFVFLNQDGFKKKLQKPSCLPNVGTDYVNAFHNNFGPSLESCRKYATGCLYNTEYKKIPKEEGQLYISQHI